LQLLRYLALDRREGGGTSMDKVSGIRISISKDSQTYRNVVFAGNGPPSPASKHRQNYYLRLRTACVIGETKKLGPFPAKETSKHGLFYLFSIYGFSSLQEAAIFPRTMLGTATK
jgi:hypothetical protein